MKNQNAKELTDLECRKTAPKEKPYKISDRGGLQLLVTPSGGKLWHYAYRFEGKQKLMALGKYPDVSLASARARHAEARRQLAEGADPMAERREKKQQSLNERQKTSEPKLTFETIAREWYAWWKEGKNKKYALNVENRLEEDVIAKIGHLHPDEVPRREIISLIEATAKRGAHDIARRNLQFIRLIYKRANHREIIETNPAATIDTEMILKPITAVKFPHLAINEVPGLLRDMENYSGNVLTRLAMKFLSLTFVRTSEMINAHWEEIDWTNQIWRIPKEHMKMKEPHLVPLSKQALRLLENLKSISGETNRLFPDYNGGAGVMSNNTILKALERMGYKGRMTGHGWRHIASTFLRGKNHGRRYDKWVVEAQMSHVERGVAAVYNEAEYLEERTEMMQHWADALDSMRETGA